MTVRIWLEDVELIYATHVAAGPLRDRRLLEGAVAAPFQAGFGREFYPTLVEKSAKLVEGISRAQAYGDGNKRLAWLSAVTFLRLNRQLLAVTEPEAADFVLGIDGTEDGLTAAALWLNERLRAL